jgi:hypothetical protein
MGAVDGRAKEVIVSCKDGMKALWTDEAVRAVLKQRMRVDESERFGTVRSAVHPAVVSSSLTGLVYMFST